MKIDLTAPDELEFPGRTDREIPQPKITCRVCGMTAEGNQGGILLCQYCLEDIEQTRAHLVARRNAIFARLERNEQAWKAAIAEPKIVAWWEQAADRPDLHTKALSIGGRGAAVVRAHRSFCAEFDACAAELERIREGQTQVNTAMLSAVGVL